MSPLITQLEYSMTKQFATPFGLPNSADGVMMSGGTLSNLQRKSSVKRICAIGMTSHGHLIGSIRNKINGDLVL